MKYLSARARKALSRIRLPNGDADERFAIDRELNPGHVATLTCTDLISMKALGRKSFKEILEILWVDHGLPLKCGCRMLNPCRGGFGSKPVEGPIVKQRRHVNYLRFKLREAEKKLKRLKDRSRGTVDLQQEYTDPLNPADLERGRRLAIKAVSRQPKGVGQ